MRAGHDYIGVGVGAMVFNQEGNVFLARRGPQASNEQGTWEFPGCKVSFGETLADAIVREFEEEYGMTIELIEFRHRERNDKYVKLVQFPFTLTYVITDYKCQGLTFE